MIQLDAFTKKLFYHSKYGEIQDAADIPSELTVLAPERFVMEEVHLYTAYGETFEEAEHILANYVKCSDVGEVTRTEIKEVD